jgi:DNA end-binding protein Ku
MTLKTVYLWVRVMAPRPNWKGYLKLSLVSCPVALYNAASQSDKISLHMLNRDTGNRLRRQMVDEETGDAVETNEQIRGYEISRGHYVQLENDELDNIALDSTHTIDIDKFVPRADIDEVYLDTPYYLVPDDEVGEEAFAVIREAMKKRKVVGLARVVLYRRERILMLEPRARGILATALRYGDEVRDETDYFDDIDKPDVPAEMVKLAEHIIDTKAGKFDPSQFADRYEDALVELIKSKQSGEPIKPPPTGPSGNVINLMDALRRSIKDAGGNPKEAGSPRGAKKRSVKSAKPTKKPVARRRRPAAKSRMRKAG